jgi:exodeoxyribonuclease-3
MMKIISYNVNGIRAACKKGLVEWLAKENADIVCLQEIKAIATQIDVIALQAIGYHYCNFHSAQKLGYSGVAILSKIAPKHIEIGCGIAKYDVEGRVIRADFDNFSVMSVYMPSGTSGEERQNFKYQWLEDFYSYSMELCKTYPNLLIGGDYNIAHTEMDIHNPKSNKNSSGFLLPEREWLTKFFSTGFFDTFRNLQPTTQQYTWWSSRTNAREKNIGWRIDYWAATQSLLTKIQTVRLANEAQHSDHCPVIVEISL